MKSLVVGVVDYGVGNHSSLIHCLKNIGYKVRLTSDPLVLDVVDTLILPGVGAFPFAMQALHSRGLVRYLQQQALSGRPMIGICLGMELLASVSYEFDCTVGLDLIPGEIRPLLNGQRHIGWNALDCLTNLTALTHSQGQDFYFNHTFKYEGPQEYVVCRSWHGEELPAVIQNKNVIGLQFHPEKSQIAGQSLLQRLISDGFNA